MPKWIKKLVLKIAWPRIQEFLISYVKNDEYQKKLVDKINAKVDIPGIPEESEAKLMNQIYDAGQEATAEFIESIDIETVLDKVGL